MQGEDGRGLGGGGGGVLTEWCVNKKSREGRQEERIDCTIVGPELRHTGGLPPPPLIDSPD